MNRWLLDNDHDEEGIVVIANLYGKGDIHNPKAREEYREIKMNVLLQRQEGERTYAEMFRRYSTRVFIAMSAQGLAQLNGINVISYYAPKVFESAGWVGRNAVLMAGVNSITYFLSTIPPWYLVDRWGRRPILLSGAIVMSVSLSLISYWIYLDIPATPNLVVIFVMIYNAAFGYSWGPIPWLYPPEILPLSIRSKGASLSTATNWAFNWLVGELTPILQDYIKWRLYLVHAFFCAVSFVVGKLIIVTRKTSIPTNDLKCTSSTPRLVESVWRRWTHSSATRARSSAPRPSMRPRPALLCPAHRSALTADDPPSQPRTPFLGCRSTRPTSPTARARTARPAAPSADGCRGSSAAHGTRAAAAAVDMLRSTKTTEMDFTRMRIKKFRWLLLHIDGGNFFSLSRRPQGPPIQGLDTERSSHKVFLNLFFQR